MALEDQLAKQNSPSDLPNGSSTATNPGPLVPGTYQRGVPIHSQPLFTTAILTALKQVNPSYHSLEIHIYLSYTIFKIRNLPDGCIPSLLGS